MIYYCCIRQIKIYFFRIHAIAINLDDHSKSDSHSCHGKSIIIFWGIFHEMIFCTFVVFFFLGKLKSSCLTHLSNTNTNCESNVSNSKNRGKKCWIGWWWRHDNGIPLICISFRNFKMFIYQIGSGKTTKKSQTHSKQADHLIWGMAKRAIFLASHSSNYRLSE